MEEKIVEQEGISLADIWAIVKKYWIGLVCITAGCMLLGVLGAFFVLPKNYTATQSVVYLETTDNSQVTEGEISASRTIVQIASDFMSDKPVYVNTSKTIKEKYKIDIDYKTLMDTLTVTRVGDLKISFTYKSGKKEEIPYVLNTFTAEALNFVQEQLHLVQSFSSFSEITSDDVEDESTSKILVIGASIVVGLVIGVCFEFIMNSLDKTIKDRKYIEDTFKVKVIGLIPDLLDSKDKKTY